MMSMEDINSRIERLLEKKIEDQQSEIADLTLCLKETNILLVASIKREKELLGAIARHKEVMFGDTLPPFPDDQELYKMLGEPQPASDPTTCPKCKGPADNGHDRCMPPHAYHCSKCEVKFKGVEG